MPTQQRMRRSARRAWRMDGHCDDGRVHSGSAVVLFISSITA
jgi:hypothetical protein